MAGKAKPGFYVAVLLVVAGLIGVAVWRYSGSGKSESAGGADKPTQQIDPKQLGGQAEDPNSPGITTVKEYEFVPSAKLPPIKGTASYDKMKDRTVKFAINVWAGWAPIIYANNGFSAGKMWEVPGGKPFKVELVLIDEPVSMRDTFAAGRVHIGWATVDMLPLLLEGLQRDSRTMPRVYQQIDWSNGGDGIVVRESIKSIGDLRGKKIVLAENSPSHYFLLNTLVNAGLQPSEVELMFTKDAFQAAAAFNADKKIAGVVTWAPDIYKLSELPGNRMLVTTGTANKLIADVWFARADFAKDHPDIMEGLVRGIFDAMIELGEDAAKQEVAKLMAEGYSIPANETLEMLADAHWTNYAENREFLLNANNPTNFEQTYKSAYYVYGAIRQVKSKVPFDQVMDFSVIKKLAKVKKYAEQKDEYSVNFAPASASDVQVEDPILTKTVVIHFFPNSHELHKKVKRNVNGKEKDVLYDPNVDLVVEEIGKLAGQYGAARVVIEGHTDASMKGRGVDEALVLKLSENRANAVKTALLRKFKTLPPNQLSPKGMGWRRPADANEPGHHAKNRRVEIKVYPAEAQ